MLLSAVLILTYNSVNEQAWTKLDLKAILSQKRFFGNIYENDYSTQLQSIGTSK